MGSTLRSNEKSHMALASNTQTRGSIIVTLFIMVSLIGILSFVILGTREGGITWINAERTKASTVEGTQCTESLRMAEQRLKSRGCTAISYSLDGSNVFMGSSDNGSCSIYHVSGGGLKPCPVATIPETICNGAVSIGTVCSDGSVYVGLAPSTGTKMYLAPKASPVDLPYNNGNTSGDIASGATNLNDGEANTNLLMTVDSDSVASGFQPHRAAKYCYDLVAHGKDDWYLPARNEFNIFDNQRSTIGGDINVTSTTYFRVSNEGGITTTTLEQCMSGGGSCPTTGVVGKNTTYWSFGSGPVKTMCIRKD